MISQKTVRKPVWYTALLVLILSLPLGSARAAEAPGVPNFHQVNDHVYRGAQPSDEGFENLARLGVKTIIDLRESGHRSRSEERAVTADGMRYVSIPMKGFATPTEEQISQALALLENVSAGPVFVHCRLGKDRTGTVIAVYRIVHDHWANQNALQEARSYGMSWLQFAMQSYIRDFQAEVNLAASPSASPAAVAAQ